jgi:hypothetical protein
MHLFKTSDDIAKMLGCVFITPSVQFRFIVVQKEAGIYA